jgi:predicted dehydrogenase
MPRWGVLGTSFISHTVASAINGSPDSQVVAVFGRDVERLASFADKHGAAHRCESIEALVALPEVDVVYVGLPSHLHASAAMAALRAGKPTLSEKALTTTMADAHALIDEAKKSSVLFLEGLMYLSHPVMARLADVLRSGVLGKVRGVSGYYAANIWSKANPLGMGTIYNLGCYPVSLLHWIIQVAAGPDAFGQRKVVGLGNLADDGSHIRDASLSVRFGCGLLATLQSSDSFGNDSSFAVQGDKAVLRFRTNPWLPPTGKSIMEIRSYKGEVEEIVIESPMDAFEWQVKTVEECIKRGDRVAARPSPTWNDSLEIMDLLTEWEAAVFANTRNEQT